MSYACPICRTSLDPVPRHPHYVCADCATKAVAADGRRLQFSNVSLSGGFAASYADTGGPYASHACWINAIPCHAVEAHFYSTAIEVMS